MTGRAEVVAIFGPTGVGKTAVAIELAAILRRRGDDPVAVSCDAIQVYRGLEVLSNAPSEAERERLEHRLLGIVGVEEEFSAGRYAELAHAEIDGLLAIGRRPLVVGGAGLYLRAALSEIELKAPVGSTVRAAVAADLERRGAEALLAELPADVAAGIHVNDRKKIVRMVELVRSGQEPTPAGGGRLWTARLRHPTLLVGLIMDRGELRDRIEERTEAMLAAGVRTEVAAAEASGASATARMAHGYRELLAGDIDGWKTVQRAYVRRQLTWMRKMQRVDVIDRTGLGDADVAGRIAGMLG